MIIISPYQSMFKGSSLTMYEEKSILTEVLGFLTVIALENVLQILHGQCSGLMSCNYEEIECGLDSF